MKWTIEATGSDGTGCFRIKVKTNTTQFVDMRIAAFTKRRQVAARVAKLILVGAFATTVWWKVVGASDGTIRKSDVGFL